jgi:hypothetical protein
MAIFDLIDADTMVARKIADLVRSDDIDAAKAEAQSPRPLHILNELMRLSNLPIEIRYKNGKQSWRAGMPEARTVWRSFPTASATSF